MTTIATGTAKAPAKPTASAPAKTTKTIAKPAAKKMPVKVSASQPVAKPAAKTATKATSKPVAKPAVKAPPKPEKVKKPKMVRDSFTMPKAEFAVIDALKVRATNLKKPVKKTELLRAGIKALAAMSDAAFLAAVTAVPNIKTGRPSKA